MRQPVAQPTVLHETVATPPLDSMTDMLHSKTVTMNGFPYQSLKSDKSSIRLIQLQPAAIFTSDVHCDIYHISLDTNPVYEALSYAWGDANITETIYIQQHPVQATVNLVSALRHLRLQDVPRTLWVDAVCIDQTNLEERGSQVAFMARIYSRAKCDVLWISNDPTDDARNAFSFVKDLSIFADHYNNESQSVRRLRSDKTIEQAFFALRRDQRSENLYKIFNFPLVWTRIWIVQEVAMAQNVIMQCGFHSLSADTMTKLCRVLLGRFNSESGKIIQHCGPALRICSMFGASSSPECLSTLQTWARLSDMEAKDPRDKLFALVSIAKDDPAAVIPDYTKSVREISVTAIRNAITRHKNLDSLCLGYRLKTQETMDLPSWAPDLTGSTELCRIIVHDEFLASAKTLASDIDCNRTAANVLELNLSGIWLDTVAIVYEPISSTWGWKELQDRFRRWEKMVTDTYCTGEPGFLAFTKTLMLDTGIDYDRASESEIIQFNKLLQRLASSEGGLCTSKGNCASLSANLQDNSFLRSFNCRFTCRFCITMKGFLVMAPTSTQMDDTVCVLYGSKMPHILRPVSDTKDKYEFIGPSYVHGFMYGEALDWRDQGRLEEQTFNLV